MGDPCARCGEDSGFAMSHRDLKMCVEALVQNRDRQFSEILALRAAKGPPIDVERLNFLVDSIATTLGHFLSDGLTVAGLRLRSREWLQELDAYQKREGEAPSAVGTPAVS